MATRSGTTPNRHERVEIITPLIRCVKTGVFIASIILGVVFTVVAFNRVARILGMHLGYLMIDIFGPAGLTPPDAGRIAGNWSLGISGALCYIIFLIEAVREHERSRSTWTLYRFLGVVIRSVIEAFVVVVLLSLTAKFYAEL